MQRAGLESYAQHFTARHGGNRTNVFAIVRAGRAQSTEAMLLCARADASGSHTLAMLVAFAHYAQRECRANIICYILV
jgi:hypothetical protein